ncbi:hypothetical protein BH11PAT2_BH11PAT2_10160 [soil metagenome]
MERPANRTESIKLVHKGTAGENPLTTNDFVLDNGVSKRIIGFRQSHGGKGTHVLIENGTPRVLEDDSDTIEVIEN